MLTLVIGPAGSGKTTVLQRRAARAAAQGRKVLLLVPGQFVFASERQLLSLDGGSQVQVLSFERMAHLFGAEGSKVADAAAKQALMSVALKNAAPHLELYQRLAAHDDFCSYALAAVHQFKMAGMDAAAVAKLCERTEDGPLKQKLNDFWFIMAEYERVLGDRYFDPDDQLRRLRDLLVQNNPFSGSEIYVDSFSDFTSAEYELLTLLMPCASSMTVSLCGDETLLKDVGDTLFAHTRKTALRLLRIAAESGVRADEPQYLAPDFRAKNDVVLAESAYRSGEPVLLQGDDIQICACGGRRTEAEWVCTRIRKLVMEENMRYGGIVVICRDDSGWQQMLSSAMAVNGIPFYCDFRKPLSQTPVFRFVEAACRTLQRLDASGVISCCRTGISRLDAQQIGRLQDYLYVNSVSPEAVVQPFDEETIEPLRLAAVTPLQDFARAVQGADAQGFARAVYELLCAVNAEECVTRLASAPLPPQLRRSAPDVRRGYNAFMQLLDSFAEVMAGHSMSAAEYFTVLQRMAQTLTLGEAPPVIDAVQFGRADLIRPHGAQAVFIIGANDGVFPARPAPLYPFSQRETAQLSSMTEGLCEDVFELSQREEFLVYSALFCAESKIFISYTSGGGENGGEEPSAFVGRIAAMLPQHCRTEYSALPIEEKIYSLHQARAALSETSGAEHASVAVALSHSDREFVKIYENARRFGTIKRGAQAGKLLFGGNMALSSTRVEQFYTCRFRYFCRYGIGVQPLRRNKLDALNYGTAFHYVLENLLRQYGAEQILQLPVERLRELCGELFQGSGVPLAVDPDDESRSGFVLTRMCARLCDDVRNLCRGIAAGKFVPVDFEVSIGGEDAAVPPYTVRQDGRTLTYSGKVDRIDEYRTADGRRYIRIADYKTGSVDFDARRLEDGLGLQMLYYAKAVGASGSPYADAVFAGFLYTPVNVGTVSADGSKAARERDKARRMTGLVLADGIVEAAFGEEFPLYSAAKPVSEFAPLLETAEQKLVEMAAELGQGVFDAAPNPALPNAERACKYCDYRSVCFRSSVGQSDASDD